MQAEELGCDVTNSVHSKTLRIGYKISERGVLPCLVTGKRLQTLRILLTIVYLCSIFTPVCLLISCLYEKVQPKKYTNKKRMMCQCDVSLGTKRLTYTILRFKQISYFDEAAKTPWSWGLVDAY